VEYIPQLDDITTSRMQVQGGYALPPESPGLGIAWDWVAIEQRQTTHMEIQAS
jgi:L-alanine-DL-glutamate epimerase-like enolase superfamily enzyme